MLGLQDESSISMSLEYSCAPRSDAEFAVDPRKVLFDGFDRHEELRGDVTIE